MAQPDIDEILTQTLEDMRLSRSERRAIGAVLEDRQPDATELALFRFRAFEIAKGRMKHPDDRRVVEWLEDVVKALIPRHRDAPDVAKVFFSPRDNCPRQIRRLIDHARHKLDVCVFTITDDRISDSLLDAHRRGVKVRVISDDDKAHDRGSDSMRLEQAGVAVRYDESEHHMHHKFALFDAGTLLTGSYNWTRSAARDNQENLAVVNDPRLVKAYQGEFDRLWRAFG